MKRPTVFTPSGDRRDRQGGYGDRGFRHRSGPGGTRADRDEGGNRNLGTIGEQNNGEADGFKSGGRGGGGRFRGRQPDGGGGGDDRNSPGGRRGSPPRGNHGSPQQQRLPPDREQQQLGEQQQHSPPVPAAPPGPGRPQQQDRGGPSRLRRRRGNRERADAGDDGGRQNNREAGSGRSWFRRQQGQRDGGFRGEPRNGGEQQPQREADQQQRQSPPAQQEQPREQQQPAPAAPPGPERRVLPPRRVVIPSRRVVARSGRFPRQQDQEGQNPSNRTVQDQNIGRPPQRKSTVRVQVEHPLHGQRQVYLMATRQQKQPQQNGDANRNQNQQQNNQQNDRDQLEINNNDDTRNNIRPNTNRNANNISSRRGGERSQGGGERQQQEDRAVHGRRGQQARSRNEQQQQRKPPAEEQGTSSSAPATTGQSSNEQQQMSTRELMREARDLVGVILSGPESEEDGGGGQQRSNKNNNKKNSSCVQFLVYQFKSRRFTYCVSVTTKNFSTSTVGSWHRLLFRKAVNLEPSEEKNNKDAVATSPLDPFKCIPCQRRVLTRCFGNQSHFLVMATRRQDATLLADGKYRYHSRLGSIVVDRKELVDSELESILVGEKSEEREAEEEGTTSANVIPERIRIWCFPNLSPPNGHISQQVEGFQLKKIDERFYAASSEEEEEEEEEYEVGSMEESEGHRRRENNSNSNAPSLVDVDEDGSLLLLTNGIQRVCTIRGPVQRVQLSPRFSDWLSQRIEEHYLRSRMPPERRRQMEQFVRDLEQLIAEKFLDPFMRLELFGSVNSGFGSDGCDLDICLVNAINETDPKLCMSKRRRILVFITELLRANPDFDQITSVLDARTPIVKFEHKPTGFHGDISVENQLALYNTELLKLYTQFDGRVAPLGFAIKRWAKVNGVNDAAAGSISSYAYVVMLIHYLQHCQPPVLPFLQEHPRHPSLPEGRVEGWEVKYAKDILTIREQQPEVFTNRQSTAQLLHGFLGYFGREFCSLTDIVQIRRRRQCTKQEANLPLRRRLCVEDPFDLDHNLTSGVREETLQYIVKCLRSTHRGLEDFEKQHFAQALQQQKNKEQENPETTKKAEENGGTEIDEQQAEEMPTALAQMDFVKLMAHFKQRRLVRVKRKGGGKKKPAEEEDVNNDQPDEEEEFKVPKRTKKKKMEKQRYKDFTKLLLSVDGQQLSEKEEEERRHPEQSTSNEATDVPTADATADNAAHNGDANAMSEEKDKQKCPKKNFKESVVDGGQHVDPVPKNV